MKHLAQSAPLPTAAGTRAFNQQVMFRRDLLEVTGKWADTSAVTSLPHTRTTLERSLRIAGVVVLFVASGLLVWGTGFDGRSVGPIRFVLRALPHGDKVGHFALYGAIVFALGLLLRNRVSVVRAAMSVFVLGVADEYRQLFLGGRNFDLFDVLANMAGICAGLTIALLVLRLTIVDAPNTATIATSPPTRETVKSTATLSTDIPQNL